MTSNAAEPPEPSPHLSQGRHNGTTVPVRARRTATCVVTDGEQARELWQLRLLVLAAPMAKDRVTLMTGVARSAFSLYRGAEVRHRGGCLGWLLETLLPGQWTAGHN